MKANYTVKALAIKNALERIVAQLEIAISRDPEGWREMVKEDSAAAGLKKALDDAAKVLKA